MSPIQTVHLATCPLDCPSACSLKITLQNDKIIKIAGDDNHSFTQGIICGKMSRYADIHNGERINQPLLRTGKKGDGQFKPISWNQALERISNEIRHASKHYGPESVFPFYYGGTMGVVQRAAIDRLTHKAGFSMIEKTLCSPIAESGWSAGVGAHLGPAPEEMVQSDCIVLWGINAAVTHINIMSFVKQAQQNGAQLIVVDPYQTRTARRADIHLNPRPGTDGALACAMAHVLLKEDLVDRNYLSKYSDFDTDVEAHYKSRTPEWAEQITGIDAALIRKTARLFGKAQAPFIKLGLGMSRQNNGASNIHAVSTLPTLTGAWKKPGGGALLMTSNGFSVNDTPVRHSQWINPNTRSLDMSRLGALLTDQALNPAISVLMVFNTNPAVSCPDAGLIRQGLKREDLFTVVHEQVMSDTAQLADIVLPATTFLEHADLYKSFGQYTLQHTPALLPVTSEARCNHDVVNAIAQALGYTDEAFTGTVEQRIEEIIQVSGLPPIAQWIDQHWLDMTPSERKRRFLDGFPQDDGLFHFRPGWSNPDMPDLPDHWPVNQRDRLSQEDYPLDFMTPPDNVAINSTFSLVPSVQKRREPPTLWIHPNDADALDIGEGDRVLVSSTTASLTFLAHRTQRVQRGLCLCEGMHRAEAFPEKMPLNALTRADRTEPNGGPALHDNRVNVFRVSAKDESVSA
ncbi:MAG: molybdopterin-dependent oxidoreductase [Magnetococcales bacterium]|nr:molybdopterin-dependent oxidoreductase [Magnetococcales bacterium]